MKKYLKLFFTVWAVLLIANQIFIFNGCFTVYCVLAALPHTGIISFFLARYLIKKEKDSQKGNEDRQKIKTDNSHTTYSTPKLGPNTKVAKNYIEKNNDPLKKKGDQYEKLIGVNFEEKGNIVIYNGFIQGYEDEGVDIIAVSPIIKSINLIQCKNWTRKSMGPNHIIDIYEKLNKFDFGCCMAKIEDSTILGHLQFNDVDKDLLIKQLGEVRTNYDGYIVRKTLYISSEKVVNLEVGKYLKMMKKNIFRYKDMKIVLVEGLGN